MLNQLIIIRNTLYRYFAIGYILLAISGLSFLAGKSYLLNMYQSLFHIDATSITLLVLYILATVKVFLWFFVLIPALALHWTINRMKKNEM